MGGGAAAASRGPPDEASRYRAELRVGRVYVSPQVRNTTSVVLVDETEGSGEGMDDNLPDGGRSTFGSGSQQYGHRAGFGQAATDSELLRQFAHAYEEQQTRGTGPLVLPEVTPEPRAPFWISGVLGLVVLVLLLAVAMVLAVMLMGPR